MTRRGQLIILVALALAGALYGWRLLGSRSAEARTLEQELQRLKLEESHLANRGMFDSVDEEDMNRRIAETRQKMEGDSELRRLREQEQQEKDELQRARKELYELAKADAGALGGGAAGAAGGVGGGDSSNRKAKAIARARARGKNKAVRPQEPRFRQDGRCGPSYPAPGAPDYGECDATANEDQKGPCCNPNSGWCGNVRGASWGHCDCPNCVDFSKGGRPHGVEKKCVKLLQANKWSESAVCRPLFKDHVDTSATPKDSNIMCRYDAELGESLCLAHNIILDVSGGKASVRGNCFNSALSTETINGVAQLFLGGVRSVDLTKECSVWQSKPLIIHDALSATSPEELAQETIALFRAIKLIDAKDYAVLEWKQGQLSKSSHWTPPSISETNVDGKCYRNVVFLPKATYPHDLFDYPCSEDLCTAYSSFFQSVTGEELPEGTCDFEE